MTELMKLYEAETGESAIMLVCTPSNSPRLNIAKVTDDYIAWLEAQLTWQPVSEKPEKAGIYFAEVRPYTGNMDSIVTTAYFNGERFPWHDVVRWLPIPPQGE